MRIFCKIHETNYGEENGCDLWSENDFEHKAKKCCLPAAAHNRYSEAKAILEQYEKLVLAVELNR